MSRTVTTNEEEDRVRSDKTLTIASPPDEVWAQITDLAVLAACLPGARVESVDADGRAHGLMSVRIGAIVANFQGTAAVSRRDDEDRVLEVTADATGAQGRAQARIVGRVSPHPAGSSLDLTVSVDITGQLARLGQGMAEPVIDRLVERFGVALTERLGESPRPAEADSDQTMTTRPTGGDGGPLDIGSLMPIPDAARRSAVAVGAFLLVALLVRLLRPARTAPTVIVYACGRHPELPPGVGGHRPG